MKKRIVPATNAERRQDARTRADRERDELRAQLGEALEQQTATSEILKAISGAQTDINPVFAAIARSAVKLCTAFACRVFRADGEVLSVVGEAYGTRDARALFHGTHSEALGPDSPSGIAVRERRVVQYADVPNDPDVPERYRERARARGYRALMAVPMVRDEVVVGTIAVAREEPIAFSERQVELVKTFADQAVIAIENVRLFNETKEALEQQTAASEILRVISRSPTDVQPVFDAIVRSASRLCGGEWAIVTRYDGRLLHLAGQYNPRPGAADEAAALYPHVPRREASVPARALLDAAVVHIADVEKEEFEASAREKYRRIRLRAVLGVPMFHEGRPIGVLAVSRATPGPFSDRQIALLQIFADQAVIAIENVRLFTELQASNRELTAALDTQTATSDILRVISRSPTDLQPVFDAIVASAVRLLGAYTGTLTRVAGEQIEIAAITSTSDVGDAALRAWFPQPLSSAGPHPRTIRDRAPLNIADAHADPRLTEAARANARVRGYRSQVVVPLLRHDDAIGTISLTRREPGGFTEEATALLKTFADQAVIAIENVRLFTELQAKNRAVTEALDQQTATAEILGVISSSPTDVQPVFETMVASCKRLLDGRSAAVLRLVDQELHLAAFTPTSPEADEEIRRFYPTSLDTNAVVAAVARDRAPFIVNDTETDPRLQPASREVARRRGYRSMLVVPMLRSDETIGTVSVSRETAGSFSEKDVALLQTFADQAVIAIENVRLFREIQEKSAQLEIANQHKSDFLANMSHELRTPLNAVIGFSDVLLEGMFGEVNEKQTEYLRDILASGKHLLSLINDILDLSKIEAGRMELELSDFDVPAAIDNALTLMRERASRHEIEMSRVVADGVREIRADERKFKQVLLNLLSNAVKFTPAGGKVEVRAGLRDDFVEVAVRDTGDGIAPEDQQAVFEEFRQVGKSAKKVEGTGLGLALCRKFVELQGGTISLESEVGMGSTFTFTVPIRRGSENHSMT